MIEVVRAATEDDAVEVGRAVARSNLVKTAFFASDPNLGRILAAVGNAGIANLDQSKVGMWLGDVQVVEESGPPVRVRR